MLTYFGFTLFFMAICFTSFLFTTFILPWFPIYRKEWKRTEEDEEDMGNGYIQFINSYINWIERKLSND